MPSTTLTPAGYKPRLIERRLDDLMRGFGCVEIRGAKWCGKTWTALSRSASVTRLDDSVEREMAEVDPALALVGDQPHLVDEWQEVPAVWDAARRFVDDSGNERGLLLLTGSSGLSKKQREAVRHSGTGRIAHLTMRPLSLVESGDSSGEVSLQALANGEGLSPVERNTGIDDVIRWCCRGGWPANLGLNDDIAMETAVQYVSSVINDNVIGQNRSPAVASSLMRAIAMNESQAVTYRTLAADMAAYSGTAPDEDTIAAYMELLERFFVVESLPGWEPPMRAKARVRTKPKRYFVDPSLAVALLNATPQRLMRDAQTLGMLFENLVLRDLRVFLSTYRGLGNKVSYYRDDKGLEVDFIVESGGRWGAIEAKLSDTKADDAAASLLALQNKVCRNNVARIEEPAFLAVVVGKGHVAYQRSDGVHVIPMATLGA